MEIRELVEIGLTENQAKVFLELLKSPNQTAGGVSKNLHLDRSFTYGILDGLIKKGLIGFIEKNNKRYYLPSDPENILKGIEEKRQKAVKIVNEINSLKKSKKDEFSVKVYEGKSGLKTYIRKFLEYKYFDTFGGGGNLDILSKLEYDYPNYLKEFNKKRIKGKLITSEKNEKLLSNFYKKHNVPIKTLKNLDNPVSITLFDGNVIIYSSKDNPFVITIENREVFKTFKDYFERLWNLIK